MTPAPRPSPLAPLRGKRIGIIGAGNMGQALLKGFVAAGLSPKRLAIVEAKPAVRRLIRQRYGVFHATLHEVSRQCDVMLLAVKPQDLKEVLETLRHAAAGRKRRVLIVSIAAGVTLHALERRLGRVAVVRAMPNLAAKVGLAISAIAAGRFATRTDRTITRAIFQCVGEVVELPERLFDVVTAISGSGPAYFFLIFQALRDAGMKAGLSKRVAEWLATQTALGSAQLVNELHEPLETLIARVASKKGTTEAALQVFRKRHLAEVLQAGVTAATRRSRELSSHYLPPAVPRP